LEDLKYKKETVKKKEIKRLSFKFLLHSRFFCRIFTQLNHHRSRLFRNLISKSSDTADLTKSNQRTSKATLQEENDIKDIVAASSVDTEIGFFIRRSTNSCRHYQDNAPEGNDAHKRHYCRHRHNVRKGFRPECLPSSTRVPSRSDCDATIGVDANVRHGGPQSLYWRWHVV